jgi:hypothetical protein
LKKKFSYKKFSIISIVVLTLIYVLNRDNDVVYSSPKWSCEYLNDHWDCSVTLEVENKTRTHQDRKISIRGVKMPVNPKYSSFKICGEKILNLEMAPHEIMYINEIIEMNYKPTNININVWQ